MRLIDADALDFSLIENEFDRARAKIIVMGAPTVDAVPVVRCKDCKHNVANSDADPLDSTDYTDVVCRYWMSDGCEPDDFCSRGEKRCESPES